MLMSTWLNEWSRLLTVPIPELVVPGEQTGRDVSADVAWADRVRPATREGDAQDPVRHAIARPLVVAPTC